MRGGGRSGLRGGDEGRASLRAQGACGARTPRLFPSPTATRERERAAMTRPSSGARPMSSALAAIGAEGVAPPTASRGGRTPSRGSLRGASTAGGPDELKLAMMDALVRKLRAKFPQDVTTQEVIGKEVTAFMKVDRPADQPVSEAELFALEKKIGKLLKVRWGAPSSPPARLLARPPASQRASQPPTHHPLRTGPLTDAAAHSRALPPVHAPRRVRRWAPAASGDACTSTRRPCTPPTRRRRRRRSSRPPSA